MINYIGIVFFILVFNSCSNCIIVFKKITNLDQRTNYVNSKDGSCWCCFGWKGSMLSTTRVVKQQMKWKFMIRKQIV